MAEYQFTGAHPRIFFGLIQGVNATHYPASGDPSELSHGQTIVLEPGDRVETEDEYPHAELEAPKPNRAARSKSTKE